MWGGQDPQVREWAPQVQEWVVLLAPPIAPNRLMSVLTGDVGSIIGPPVIESPTAGAILLLVILD